MSQQIVNVLVPSTAPVSQNGGVKSAQGSSKLSSSFNVITPPSTIGTPAGSNVSNPVSHGYSPGSLTDITLEQALERVNSLFNENCELKEYLKENNEMMKGQYQTMAKWKDKIHESSVFNKQKADEARTAIQQLQARNAELLALESQRQQKSSDVGCALQEEKLVLVKQVEMLRERLSATPGIGEFVAIEPGSGIHLYPTESEQQMKALQVECDKYKIKTVDLENQARLFRQQSEQLLLDMQSTQGLKDRLMKDLLAAQSDNHMLKVANQNLMDRCNCLEGNMSAYPKRIGNAAPIDINIGNLGYTTADPQHRKHAGEQAAQMQVERLHIPAENVELKQKLEKTDSELKTVRELLHQKEQLIQQYQQQQDKQFTTEGPQLVQSQVQQASNDQSLNYNSDVQSLKCQVLTLINEVHDSEIKLTAATKAIDVFKAKVGSLEQMCLEQEEGARRYQMEDSAMIGSLKDALNSTKQSLRVEKEEHQNAKQQMAGLFKDYSDLLELAKQKQKSEPTNVESAKQDTQTKQLLDDINRLTAQVIGAEEAITYREEQIKKLQHDNIELKIELENIVPVLTAQAEIFKADFDAERKAREHQHTEKEKLVQDMHNLQVQNQQLMDEVENLSKRQLMEMQQRHAPVSYGQTLHNYLNVVNTNQPIGQRGSNYDSSVLLGASASSASSLETSLSNRQSRLNEPSQHDEGEHQVLSCPKCEMQCPDVDTLQIHVLECIDQN